MQILFVPNKTVLVLMAILFFGICHAQERVTKETKIILAVNQKSEAVEHIELLANFQKIKKDELLERYGHHKFFLGVLKGSYSPNKKGISLGNETVIIMYTDKQFFPSGSYSPGDNLAPGDKFKLGNSEGEVLGNKKGELIIKTKNP